MIHLSLSVASSRDSFRCCLRDLDLFRWNLLQIPGITVKVYDLKVVHSRIIINWLEFELDVLTEMYFNFQLICQQPTPASW